MILSPGGVLTRKYCWWESAKWSTSTRWMNLLDRISIKGTVFPIILILVIYFLFLWMITVWRRSASFRSTSSSTSSSSSSSFASSPLCSSLSPSTSSSPLRYPFYKKLLLMLCYDTSSKLWTIYVRCETLITNLSPTTNGLPWQPVSSCRPSCSSNSS